MLRVLVVALLVAAACSEQVPINERHFGCLPDPSNACVYPINTAEMQCEMTFDFEVEIHVPSGDPAVALADIDITITVLESGETFTPAQLFPDANILDFTWPLEVKASLIDENPTVYDVYAYQWQNVFLPKELGKGEVSVTVTANGVTSEVNWFVHPPTERIAKNVILMVGDGMANNIVTAARLVSRGMVNGKYSDFMHMEKFTTYGLVNPSGADSIITDSANSASAYNNGHKTSVNALGGYVHSDMEDSVEANLRHPKVQLLAEHLKGSFGMSIGVITTAEVQDATPAAVYAHTRRRADKAEITRQAVEGCPTCAMAIKPEVLMGGGGFYYTPAGSFDGSDMYAKYEEEGYTVTYTKTEMEAAADTASHLLCITHAGNMDTWIDRNIFPNNTDVPDNSPNPGATGAPTDQPGLLEMVQSALKVLAKNENGFYMMIEAASIDKAMHPLDTHRVMGDTIEFDNTVGFLREWVGENGDDTLIIVTADHGHGFDVYGTVDTQIWAEAAQGCPDNAAVDNLGGDVQCGGTTYRQFFESDFGSPVHEYAFAVRTSIGTYNNAGFPDYKDEDGDGFPDDWFVRTIIAGTSNNFPDHTENFALSAMYKSPAEFSEEVGVYVNNPVDDPDGIFIGGNLNPTGSTGVHSLTDIGLHMYGPGSFRGRNIQDNTYVFHIMAMAMGVGADTGEIVPVQTVPDGLVKCVNDDAQCNCGMATFAGCLTSAGDGMCTVKEGDCTGMACLCPMSDVDLYLEQTTMCAKEAMEYYAPTGTADANGMIPCALVAGTKLVAM